MKEVQLTHDKVALVDDCDFEKLNQSGWYAHTHKNKHTFYAERTVTNIDGKRDVVYMHREVIGVPPKGLITDHKDGNGLNNQRSNLRHVTNRQNSQNRKNSKKKKTSRYPGVYWNTNRRKWHTQITINGKCKYLGQFKDEEKAFEAYKQAVSDLGEQILDEFKGVL